jgi:hypothetical protein
MTGDIPLFLYGIVNATHEYIETQSINNANNNVSVNNIALSDIWPTFMKQKFIGDMQSHLEVLIDNHHKKPQDWKNFNKIMFGSVLPCQTVGREKQRRNICFFVARERMCKGF